jgi:hypothetical protein
VDEALESARTVLQAALACPDAVSADALAFAVGRLDGLPGEFLGLYSRWRKACEQAAAAPEDSSNVPDAVDMAVPEGMPF